MYIILQITIIYLHNTNYKIKNDHFKIVNS